MKITMVKVAVKAFQFLQVGFFTGIGWILLMEPKYDEGALKKVALARGLSGVDELVASLGKSSASEISDKEANEMLLKAVGVHGFADHNREKFYSSQPKARCNSLFNDYIKAMNSTDPILADDAKSHRRDLVRYCGYKDDTGKK